jgi:hypothetical protein
MSSSTVLVVTWVMAGLVVGLYIWFVVWRVRVDRRKKAGDVDTAARMTSAIDRAARVAAEVADERREPVATATAAPLTTAPSIVTAPPAATLASVLTGITLPNDLVPLSTLIERQGVGDRVAFWTKEAPAEIVGPAFADELERLGFTVTSLDAQTLAAHRGEDRLVVVIHPDGPAATIADRLAFTTVPEMSVVVEVWLPA